MSFSEVINKAKAAEMDVGEKAPNSGASPTPPKTQSPVLVASQRGDGSTAASDGEEDEDEDMTKRIPGSFNVEDYGDGGVAMGGDAVSVLENLWRRMQLR